MRKTCFYESIKNYIAMTKSWGGGVEDRCSLIMTPCHIRSPYILVTFITGTVNAMAATGMMKGERIVILL